MLNEPPGLLAQSGVSSFLGQVNLELELRANNIANANNVAKRCNDNGPKSTGALILLGVGGAVFGEPRLEGVLNCVGEISVWEPNNRVPQSSIDACRYVRGRYTDLIAITIGAAWWTPCLDVSRRIGEWRTSFFFDGTGVGVNRDLFGLLEGEPF